MTDEQPRAGEKAQASHHPQTNSVKFNERGGGGATDLSWTALVRAREESRYHNASLTSGGGRGGEQ